ncbi:MAG TPA: PAS domain-containing protein [Mucilaginibacter sp.]|nr:PAS domain-containing protein [Mucilaginibacter sp.]
MDQRLVSILKNSSDIFCITDNKGNIISVNSAWQHFTGYNEQESIGVSLTGLINPADRTRFSEVLKSIFSLKNIENFFARVKTRDGRFPTFSWSACVDGDANIYFIGIYINEELNVRDPYHISDKVQQVLAMLSEGFFMLDANWRINAFNPAFQKLLKMPEDELYGADFRAIDKLTIDDEVVPAFKEVYKTGKPCRLEYYDRYCKGWLRLNVYPYRGELIIFIRDISHFVIERQVLGLEKKVLELNFKTNYPLARIVDELLNGIEEIFPEMYCSILEVDDEQEKVYHLSGPRLPEEYSAAISGQRIGPYAGSCGTAAYHRKQVIVSDIANSPFWIDYKQYILPFGFKACWSTPVISAYSTKVLATFAIYYDTVREPGKEELTIIERTVNILRSLIESKRNEAQMAGQHRRLQEIASISSHSIRRPVATILGLVSLFDQNNLANPLNREIIEHITTSSLELDDVIHMIVEKTANI